MKLLKLLFWGLLGVVFAAGFLHLLHHFIDYPVYETAGRKILEGDTAHLYDVTRNVPGGYYYSYFFALAFAPFAFAGPFVGKFLLYLLFCVSFWKILTFSVDCAFRLTPSSSRDWYRVAFVTSLLSAYALNDAFMNANIGILLLVLCILAFEWREKNPWLAGGFLAVAIVFKFYPLLVLCFFVWEKRWKLVFSSIIGFVLLFFALPLATLGKTAGLKMLSDQWYVISHFGSHWSYDSIIFQSLHATVMRYASVFRFDQQTAFKLSVLASCSAVFLFYLPSFLRSRKTLDELFVLRMFLLLLALVPVLVPVSWYNMGLFYTPIIASLVAATGQGSKKEAAIGLALYAILFCLTTPDIVGSDRNDLLEFYAVPFFGVCFLLGAYLFTLGRACRATSPELQVEDT